MVVCSTTQAKHDAHMCRMHLLRCSHPSPIHLTKHDVLGANQSDDVGEHVALGHHVERREVGEPRGADLASVPVCACVCV